MTNIVLLITYNIDGDKMKRFKPKKKFNKIFIIIIIISIVFIRYLYHQNKLDKNYVANYLVNDFIEKYKNIKDIDFILKYAFDMNYNEDIKENRESEESKDNELTTIKEEVNDRKPVVYIYNTHQEEKYLSNYMNGYNISTGVLQASKILKEYLHEYNIESIVEEDSISDKLHSLNWKYGYSYKVSRMFLESAFSDNPSLKYFIDLHRDSSKYDATTTEINGEKYARILFVIGLDNQNYEPNLEMANKLKEKIIAYDKSLFRGIMKKSGKGVNGIYNQDFNPNCILIEVGGQYNSIEEVDNTLKILAKIFSEYIEDDLNEKEK